MGWRPDATQGTGQAIELTGGCRDDDIYEFDESREQQVLHERGLSGIGVQKRFDVSVSPR